ncbi:hypothetical protein D521_0328 [beta proteobacterium CB]|nr:hypothetical protein D521_0328 [beta proteobacterium CB]
MVPRAATQSPASPVIAGSGGGNASAVDRESSDLNNLEPIKQVAHLPLP